MDFCSYSTTTTKIRFLQDFGDLPLIVADGVGLGLSVGSSPRISVTKIQGGTKENEPCKIAAQSLLLAKWEFSVQHEVSNN